MRLALASGIAVAALLAAVTPVAAKAALTVTDPSPLSLRGVGFIPYERVTLVAEVGERYVRTITASKSGIFTVSFRSISLGQCQGYIVRATGSRGSRAYLRFIPECNPP